MAKDTIAVSQDRLRNPRYLRAYLQDHARKGPRDFRLALREAVRAQEGGLTGFSRRTGMARTGLYKALSEQGNPSYSTICKVLDALGLGATIGLRSYAVGRRVMPNEKTKCAEGGEIRKFDGDHANTTPPKAHEPTKTRIKPGSAKGMTYYMADDFNQPLTEFSDYM